MTFGTFFVLMILAAVVALVIRSMVRDKKAGKSLQCGMNCSKCNGHCAQMAQKGQFKKQI